MTRILIDETRKVATGVEFYHNQKLHTVKASREVILSAGAINSPQLLMLSGVGPSKNLAENGIETIVDLPVGQNLVDHVGFSLHFTANGVTMPKEAVERVGSAASYAFSYAGPYTLVGCLEAAAFFESNNFSNPDAYPDFETFLLSAAPYDSTVGKRALNLDDKLYEQIYRPLIDEKVQSFSIVLFNLRPKSRGEIKLKSGNPFDHPLIYPEYYSHPEDIRLSIQEIRKLRSLDKTKAFMGLNSSYIDTTPRDCQKYEYNSDAYWGCNLRHFSYTIYHYSGTCKMGPSNDETAVVDSRLRVLGIENVRVADASIMPAIVSGHPNAAVFMIAEKAADMIKQDWKYL